MAALFSEGNLHREVRIPGCWSQVCDLGSMSSFFLALVSTSTKKEFWQKTLKSPFCREVAMMFQGKDLIMAEGGDTCFGRAVFYGNRIFNRISSLS